MENGEADIKRVEYGHAPQGPLAGVRVLDLSRLVAGNILSVILADFGADVVKVEGTKGDPLRDWLDSGQPLYWKTYGRNKRSIVLDLHQEAAKQILLKMAKDSDVLIENFKPKTLEKMGLAPDLLLEVNPKLVIVRISGFGQDGPYASLPGFGSLVEAMSGLADRTGFADREPVLPPFPAADMIAGILGSSATLMALRAVDHGLSNGQVVDLSLLEPLFSLLGPEAMSYSLTHEIKDRSGSASNTTSPRNVYLCKDGAYVALSASMQSMAERLFEVIGRPDMIKDPRFKTNSDRLKNRDEVDEIVGGWFKKRDRSEALEFMRQAGVTAGPVYDIKDVLEDQHFIEREIVVEVNDPDLGWIPTQNVVPKFTSTPGAIRSAAPRLSEHTTAILRDLGLSEEEISELKAQGITI